MYVSNNILSILCCIRAKTGLMSTIILVVDYLLFIIRNEQLLKNTVCEV